MKRKVKAFTLIEVLVVIAIIAIALSLAMPDLRRFIRQSSVNSVSNQVMSGIATARTESIRNGKPTLFVLLSGSTSGPNGESNGYVIALDNNNDGLYDSATDTILSSSTGFINENVNLSGSSLIKFAASGFQVNTTGAIVSGNLTVTDKIFSDVQKTILIYKSGRVKICDLKIETTCTAD